MNRNLYRASLYAYSFSNTGLQTEGASFYEIKDNKMEFMVGINAQSGVSERPITRFLLADKQSQDSARISSPNLIINTGNYSNYYMFGYSTLNAGIPSHYVKNFNRYNYDVWTNTGGWVIKYNNDSWYRHYMWRARNYKSPIYAAHITIMDNITASFDLSFDYYNDNSQIASAEYSFTASLLSGLPENNLQQYAGALAVFVLKDGAEFSTTRILPKSSTPQTYKETFTFLGSGSYSINLGLSNPYGYVALRNITSKFSAPDSENILVKSNPFTMNYFEKTIDKLQIRDYMNETDFTPKFRLKGARMS
jgi:hypothetical protein